MRRVIIWAVVPAAVAAGIYACSAATSSPALPQASCGMAHMWGLSASTQLPGWANGADKAALNCFAAAARKCQHAGIHIGEQGVDTFTDEVFIIDSGGT